MILNENGGLRMSDLGYQMFVVEKKNTYRGESRRCSKMETVNGQVNVCCPGLSETEQSNSYNRE